MNEDRAVIRERHQFNDSEETKHFMSKFFMPPQQFLKQNVYTFSGKQQ